MPTEDVAARAGFHKVTDGTNTVAVKAASTPAAAADPSLVIAVSPNGGNLCLNPTATLNNVALNASGTTAAQIVALSGTTKIYVCAITVIGGGTSPTFSLVQGTGTNCATGQTVVVQAIPLSTATTFSFPSPAAVAGSGQALCTLLTGTSPTAKGVLTYVQG
jgi:hypothetical protein